MLPTDQEPTVQRPTHHATRASAPGPSGQRPALDLDDILRFLDGAATVVFRLGSLLLLRRNGGTISGPGLTLDVNPPAYTSPG